MPGRCPRAREEEAEPRQRKADGSDQRTGARARIGNAIFAATDARPRPGQCAAGACAKGV